MDSEQRPGVHWLERVPSWTFLAILAGAIGVAFLLSFAAPEVFWNPPEPAFESHDARCPANVNHLEGYGFFYDYYWGPILCDEGYTPINTATWAVLLGVLLLWLYRLTVELGERADFTLIAAVVPYLVWGSIYRVLEDADLFAPYGTNKALPDMPDASGFLGHTFDVFFVTPLIYVEIMFIAVGFLLLGHRARRIAQGRSIGHGLQYFAYTLVVLVALYTVLWASNPSFLRWVAHPLVAVGAALVTFWVMWRHATSRGRFDTHLAMAAYGLFFLVIGLYYVFRWMLGGVDTWHALPTDPATRSYPVPLELAAGTNWPAQWWILVAMFVAPALVAYSTWRKGRILGGAEPHDPTVVRTSHRKGVIVLMVVLFLEAIAAFLTILGMSDLAQRQIADAWGTNPGGYVRTFSLLAIGPVAIAAGTAVIRRLAAGGVGIHPNLLYYAAPLNLLMVFGQMTDALMTSLGIDLFHYTEKHVLPGYLIEQVDALGLPAPFGQFPTAIVMIPLKLLIVLLVVVAIDASKDQDLRGRENLVGLVKMGIIMVGLSPGIRDGVRLAMAV